MTDGFFPKHASSIQGSDFDMVVYPFRASEVAPVPPRPPDEQISILKSELNKLRVKLLRLTKTLNGIISLF